MTQSLSVLDIAKTVAACRPGGTAVEHVDNPRVECEQHYYQVTHSGLVALGLRPHLLADTLIESMIAIADRHRHRARLDALLPTVRWRATSNSP